MDRNLSLHAQAAYPVAQFASGLIIILRVSSHDTRLGAAAWFSLALELVAVFLLGSISRILGGNIAGAVSLVAISLCPLLLDISTGAAISFFCLTVLIWVLTTRDWTRDTSYFSLCLTLGTAIAVGSLVSLSFLILSPFVVFAYLLLRYVRSDSLQPYRALWRSLRTHRTIVLRDILVIAVAPLFLLAYVLVYDSAQLASTANLVRTDPVHYAASASRLLFRYLGWPENSDSFLAPFTTLLLIGSAITFWWLFVSIQSGSGLPFCLTGIPVAYLVAGALSLNPSARYAVPVHPIVLANLITFLGLWWKGRANKRVLDSTRN